MRLASMKSCKELFSGARAWNATTTILTAFFLVVGTLLLTQSCFVPDNGMNAADCASQTSVLLADSWVLIVLVATGAFILIAVYQILVAVGVTCDGFCNNERHTIFLSLVAAVCAAGCLGALRG